MASNEEEEEETHEGAIDVPHDGGGGGMEALLQRTSRTPVDVRTPRTKTENAERGLASFPAAKFPGTIRKAPTSLPGSQRLQMTIPPEAAQRDWEYSASIELHRCSRGMQETMCFASMYKSPKPCGETSQAHHSRPAEWEQIQESHRFSETWSLMQSAGSGVR